MPRRNRNANPARIDADRLAAELAELIPDLHDAACRCDACQAASPGRR